jgi:hypothetical protein
LKGIEQKETKRNQGKASRWRGMRVNPGGAEIRSCECVGPEDFSFRLRDFVTLWFLLRLRGQEDEQNLWTSVSNA